MIALRLHRYIAWRFTLTLAAILAAVAVVICLIDYVEILRRFSDDAAFSVTLGLQLMAKRLPLLLDTVLPFAFLFAALLSLLGLSRKLELVIARASGVSVWGFLLAPLFVALLVGAGSTFLLNPLAIVLKRDAEAIEASLSGGSARKDAGLWFRQEGSSGPSIMHSRSAFPQDGRLIGVTAFVFDVAGAFREKVSAPLADYRDGHWVLSDATIVSASSAPRQVARYDLATDLSAEELERTFVRPDAIAVWSLPDAIEIAKRSGLKAERLRMVFHALLNRPAFLFAMVLIAATVSLRLSRYGGAWRLILTGVAAGFLLYVLTEIVGDLGGNGIIDPILAAWLPPVIALTCGATVLLFQEDG